MRVYVVIKWALRVRSRFCVLEYHTSKSVVTVQRAFRAKYSSPPLPRDFADLNARIIAAVKNIDAPRLTRVWQELEYHIDVCPVPHDAHIEHIQLSKKKIISFPVAVNNCIEIGPLVFLL